VQEAARGREPERAGVDRVAHDGGHAGNVVVAGRRLVEAALAHHVGAQGAVSDQAAHVGPERQAIEGVEVAAVALPAPRDAGHDRVGGDVLDRLHHRRQLGLLAGAHRGERHAAVAEDERGHAVPRRRAGGRVPEQLGVEVGVDVDEPGGHQPARGVELAPAPVGDLADGRDAVAVDGHIGGDGAGPGTVDHLAGPDHDVVHGCRPPL
jgi:hypothetical protein